MDTEQKQRDKYTLVAHALTGTYRKDTLMIDLEDDKSDQIAPNIFLTPDSQERLHVPEYSVSPALSHLSSSHAWRDEIVAFGIAKRTSQGQSSGHTLRRPHSSLCNGAEFCIVPLYNRKWTDCR
eukprot:gene975-4219_t